MKFAALNVDFKGPCFDPLGRRSSPYRGVKFWYPFKVRDFCDGRLI